MPFFTDAERLRTHTQFQGTGAEDDALVAQALESAEALLAPRLTQPPPDPPPAQLVLGATCLAAAVLFRSLANREAVEGMTLTLGGQRIDSSRRFPVRMTRAAAEEAQAWEVLAPFLTPVPPRKPGDVQPTQPVLGPKA